MRITDVKVVSAQVQANVELDAGELATLGIQVDNTTLEALAQAKLANEANEQGKLTQVSYLEDDPNTLSDVVDERTAHIEADKQRLDRQDAAKADAAWNDHKDRI